MRIIYQRVQRIGRQRRGVVAVELGERAHEVGSRRVRRGEGVGLEFLLACDEARERLEREGEGRQQESETGERRADVRLVEPERLVEGRLAVEPAEEGEEREGEREAHREQPRDVSAREVSELVGEHRLDLRGREALHQGIEEDDALGPAEPGEVGVAMARALRAVHDEEPLGAESAAAEQVLDPAAKLAFLERREAVEERRDPAREDRDEEQREGDPRPPRVQPPERSGGAHEPEDDHEERDAQRERERHALHDVGHEESRRRAVEAMARLDHESAPRVEGQARDEPDGHDPVHRRELAQCAFAEETRGERVDRGEPAAHREEEEQRRVDRHRLGEREALLVERVVGRLAVRLDRDERLEIRRHVVAMALDVARLAHAEPDAPGHGGEDEDHEKRSEGGAGHGCVVKLAPRISARDAMAYDKTPLVWIDMEMSGLVPDRDRILEVAMVVTDADLNTILEAPVLVIHQEDAVLDNMDSWNKATHGKSGLVDKVKASTLTEGEAESQLIAVLKPLVAAGTAPLAGNTVHQDRRFMARYMPALDAYLHYRIVDVSTLKELARRWRPEAMVGLAKEGRHEALADVYESIAELKHYRGTFLRADQV